MYNFVCRVWWLVVGLVLVWWVGDWLLWLVGCWSRFWDNWVLCMFVGIMGSNVCISWLGFVNWWWLVFVCRVYSVWYWLCWLCFGCWFDLFVGCFWLVLLVGWSGLCLNVVVYLWWWWCVELLIDVLVMCLCCCCWLVWLGCWLCLYYCW